MMLLVCLVTAHLPLPTEAVLLVCGALLGSNLVVLITLIRILLGVLLLKYVKTSAAAVAAVSRP
jgi:hypothetical protein